MSMIPKSVQRFSDKTVLGEQSGTRVPFTTPRNSAHYAKRF